MSIGNRNHPFKAVDVEKMEKLLAMHKPKAVLLFKHLVLDPNSGIAIVGNKAAQLSVTEAKLLAAFLLTRLGQLTREAAFDALYWENKKEVNAKGVDLWMYKLRRHLKPLGYGVESVYGFGWKLKELESKEK